MKKEKPRTTEILAAKPDVLRFGVLKTDTGRGVGSKVGVASPPCDFRFELFCFFSLRFVSISRHAFWPHFPLPNYPVDNWG
jgi:hypothetical protein